MKQVGYWSWLFGALGAAMPGCGAADEAVCEGGISVVAFNDSGEALTVYARYEVGGESCERSRVLAVTGGGQSVGDAAIAIGDTLSVEVLNALTPMARQNCTVTQTALDNEFVWIHVGPGGAVTCGCGLGDDSACSGP